VDLQRVIRDDLDLPQTFKVRFVLNENDALPTSPRYTGERMLFLALGAFEMRECDVLFYMPLVNAVQSIHPPQRVAELPPAAWEDRDEVNVRFAWVEEILRRAATLDVGDCIEW
jgi:hypothetical protein